MATNQTVTLETRGIPAGAMPRSSPIPSAILESGLMSTTSKASDCFVNQKFSAKLQAFLIGYVSSIYSYYSVYK